MENWKPIADFAGYEVSDAGNVRSIDRLVSHKNRWNKINGARIVSGVKIKPEISIQGYYRVGIGGSWFRKNVPIHRLVAEAFIPNPENKPQVNHKNGIKTDNRVENLEWVTCRENHVHAYANGLRVAPKQRLSANDVLEIRAWWKTGDVSMSSLGRKWGVTVQNIKCIVDRKTWKTVA